MKLRIISTKWLILILIFVTVCVAALSAFLSIKIDRDLNNKDTEKLKNIFDKFPGNSPVEIFYKYIY